MNKPPFIIKTITAYISDSNENGDEGIVGMRTADGWVPLVCADEELVRSLRPVAVELARRTGKTIKLVRFSVREDFETL